MHYLRSPHNIWTAMALTTLAALLWCAGTPQPSNAQELWYGGFEPSPHMAQPEGLRSFAFDGQPSLEPAAAPLWGGDWDSGLENDYELTSTSSSWCLSCHDGVTASLVQNHDGTMSTPPSIRMLPEENHPIGVDYDDDPRNHLRSPFMSVPGSTASVGDLLVDGRVECVSCHAATREAAIPNSALIRIEYSNARNWCTVCHAL